MGRLRFIPTAIIGAVVIDVVPLADSRGWFARAFCAREFEAQGLGTVFVQENISFSHRRGTVRGLHYQIPPSNENKLVRCTRGAVFDMVVDTRPGSSTYLRHVGIELTANSHRALYVPSGCAHGYQALDDDCEVFYEVTDYYAPELERGVRYDDPVLAIELPLPVTEISAKDLAWPLIAEPTGRSGGRDS